MSTGKPPPSGPDRANGERPETILLGRIAALEAEMERNRVALAERQSRLMRLQRRLSRAERISALGALCARLAHELGTPLHSIGGHLDLLADEPGLPESARHRVEVLAGEVERLSGMIRGQLDALRSPPPRPVPTDINECVGRVAALVEAVLDQRGIRLTLDLEGSAAEPFLCDPAQIEQVAMNLLQNAMDAMPEGGVLVLRTSATGPGRTLSVADSGAGMDADVLAQAGEPRFSTRGPGRGTGLGLLICEEIARAHGGELWLDSKPGMGSVVTLALTYPAESEGGNAAAGPTEGPVGG